MQTAEDFSDLNVKMKRNMQIYLDKCKYKEEKKIKKSEEKYHRIFFSHLCFKMAEGNF